MTVIWHPASSAAHVALVLGSGWVAGLHCHAAGHVVTWQALTLPQPLSVVSQAQTTTTEKLLKMHLLLKLLRIFISFWEECFGRMCVLSYKHYQKCFLFHLFLLWWSFSENFTSFLRDQNIENTAGSLLLHYNITDNHSSDSALWALFVWLWNSEKNYFTPKKAAIQFLS